MHKGVLFFACVKQTFNIWDGSCCSLSIRKENNSCATFSYQLRAEHQVTLISIYKSNRNTVFLCSLLIVSSHHYPYGKCNTFHYQVFHCFWLSYYYSSPTRIKLLIGNHSISQHQFVDVAMVTLRYLAFLFPSSIPSFAAVIDSLVPLCTDTYVYLMTLSGQNCHW